MPLPFWPLASDVFVESNVPREAEQPRSEQTSNVIVPVSFASGSLNVAVSVGVYEPTMLASGGSTSAGTDGATFVVGFGTEPVASVAVTAGLPVGVARSRIFGFDAG